MQTRQAQHKQQQQMNNTTTTTTTQSEASSAARVFVVATPTSGVIETPGFRIAATPTSTNAAMPTAASSPPACPLRLVFITLALLLAYMPMTCVAVGYSYTRFEGPVAGPEHKVFVPDVYGMGMRADYVARPEYSFAYGVEDGKTRVLQNRKETRDGDEVKGVYSVVDPDGTLRVVKYTADDVHGFQAEVITNGVATIHGHGDAGVSINAQHLQQHPDADGDDDDGRRDNHAHYEVREEHDETNRPVSTEAEHTDADEDDEDDEHENYDGSSEEGYEEAEPQSHEAGADAEAEADEYEY